MAILDYLIDVVTWSPVSTLIVLVGLAVEARIHRRKE